MYVVFELGARWGADKHLIPLLAPEMDPDLLSGPLTGINALSCDNSAELHQLVSDLGDILEIDPDPPAAYQKHIDSVLELASSRTNPELKQSFEDESRNRKSEPTPTSNRKLDESQDVIGELCEERWPNDYQMRSHCLEQQKEALSELRNYQRERVPDSVLEDIKVEGKKRWPKDFQMRLDFVKQQVQSYLDLKD